MPSQRFNELMGFKNPNLKFMYSAIREVLIKQKNISPPKAKAMGIRNERDI